MPSNRILELTQQLVEARDAYDKASKEKSEAEKVKKQLEQELFAQMETEGYQNFKHDLLGTFARSEYVWCKIADNEKAFNYFRELGVFDDIMQLKPQSGRLNDLIKDNFIDKGEPVPEDLIGVCVTLKPRISRRK